MESSKKPIISCELLLDTKKQIHTYVETLKKAAPFIGDHGMNEQEFWDSGIFHSAIERLRGSQAASMIRKKRFVEIIFNKLQDDGGIKQWSFVGSEERHDYEVIMPDDSLTVIETKGCLDGNNTNIFERPPHADRFIIWSLCQNPGSDPRHNAWSGIHTRLSAEIIHKRHLVDGLIIWDMICGTAGRPCPKTKDDQSRLISVGQNRRVPPPCLYLFPRSLPDARNNPSPICWKLEEVKLLHTMWNLFNGNEHDVVEVHIDARMKDADTQRRTRYFRKGEQFSSSKWTTLKRAR